MNPIRILSSSLLAFAFTSCTTPKQDAYHTKPSPYGTASPYGSADAGMGADANPVYDTPAAYEETGTSTAAQQTPAYQPNPYAAAPSTPSAPPAPSNGAAIIHTVVAGDTLSGISAKYKVPSAAIKQANNMTNDIVVLGRKMVIPPVN
jgi:LysM repeat protein